MLGFLYLGGYGLGAAMFGDTPDEAATFTIMGPIRAFGERVLFSEPAYACAFSEPRARVVLSDPDEEG